MNNVTKIIHQIWLGDNPKPPEFVKWSKGWRFHHGDWEYKIWTDQNAEQFPLYRKLAPLCLGNATRADLLRLVVLAEFGGMYADMDMECLGNFSKVLAGKEFALGASGAHWHTPGHPWGLTSQNGWIYAEEGSSQMAAVIDRIERSSFGQLLALTFSGPWLESVAKDSGGVDLLPYQITCPFAPWERPGVPPADSLAIHHWEGSWLSDQSRAALKLPPRKAISSPSHLSTPA
jgi:hypothetical protein